VLYLVGQLLIQISDARNHNHKIRNVSSEELAASNSVSNLLIMEAAGSSETFEMSLRLHDDIPQNTDLGVLCHAAIRLRKIPFEYEALNLKSAPQLSPLRRKIAGLRSTFTLSH